MALIKCPECEAMISDKSMFCINCGYPLNCEKQKTIESTQINPWIIICDGEKYDFSELEQYFNENRYAKIYTILNEKINASIADAYNIIDYYNENKRLPDVFVVTKEIENKKEYKKKLADLVSYQTKMRTTYQKQIFNPNTPTCPKCGSTAITAGQKGYSLFTGFLGSNKTMNRCANCGHAWEPGR